MRTRDYYLGRSFSDPVNYPYGIEKSGDYSVKECKILCSIGNLFAALRKEEVADPAIEDFRLLEVVAEQAEPENDLERVYLKYWKRTHPEGYVPSMILTGGSVDFSDGYSFSD